MKILSWVLLASLGLSGVALAQETTVRIGMARSTSNSAELMATNKGYFKQFGIKLEIEDIESSANVIALLAQGRLNMVAGGISAGYFNAIEKNLPVTIVADRVSTPIRHNLMIRPDLKDQVKSFKDLKGKVVASNGTGSVSTYEVGKMLEREGLTIADVEIKVIPFPQMAVAFANKAIDAAIVIPPFVWSFEDQKIAVKFGEADDLIQPSPMTIAVIMVNTDWAKQNKELLNNYFIAWLRGARPRDRRAGQERHRAPPRTAPKVPMAGAQSERPAQCRQPARHPGVVLEEQDDHRAVPRRAAGGHELHPERGAEARAVYGREQGQQASGLPLGP